MRHLALAIAAVFMLTLVAPAFAQPFADVPADHWAFDAIAELAAKGILEGYPDGTFKGDRAMTRYEMAMALARILARIEAIKIPPPPKIPPPEVRRADIDRLQRLINEFRAELSALGVRITAVEEELAALRARLDNVKVTGDIRVRYRIFQPLFGTSDVPAFQPTPTTNLQERFRLTFTGSVTPGISAVVRLNAGNFSSVTALSFPVVGYDRAYLDASLLGASWRLGLFPYTLSPTGVSGYGLLFDPVDQTANNDAAAGLRVKFSMGGFDLEGGLFKGDAFGGLTCGGFPSYGYPCSKDYWTGRISTTIAGWTFAVSGLSQRRAWYSGFPGNDTGWSVDASGTLVPGVTAGAAWASFRSQLASDLGIDPNSSAWTAWASLDLGTIGGMSALAPTLDVWYKNYGGFDTATGFTKFGPDFTAAYTEFFGDFTWNLKGWGAQLTMQLTPKLSGNLIYEVGTDQTPSPLDAHWTELYINFDYLLAPKTTLSANYRTSTLDFPNLPFNFGKVNNEYRIQIVYSF